MKTFDSELRLRLAPIVLKTGQRIEQPGKNIKNLYFLESGMASMTTLSNPQRGIYAVNYGAAKILCVEADLALLESRCAVLKTSGYDVALASPKVAESVLRSQKFDLVVASRLSGPALHGIANLSDGANVLVLKDLTIPSELLSLVAQRLNGVDRGAPQEP